MNYFKFLFLAAICFWGLYLVAVVARIAETTHQSLPF